MIGPQLLIPYFGVILASSGSISHLLNDLAFLPNMHPIISTFKCSLKSAKSLSEKRYVNYQNFMKKTLFLIKTFGTGLSDFAGLNSLSQHDKYNTSHRKNMGRQNSTRLFLILIKWNIPYFLEYFSQKLLRYLRNITYII